MLIYSNLAQLVHVSHENLHTIPNLPYVLQEEWGKGGFSFKILNVLKWVNRSTKSKASSSSPVLQRGTFYILPSRHEDGLINIFREG